MDTIMFATITVNDSDVFADSQCKEVTYGWPVQPDSIAPELLERPGTRFIFPKQKFVFQTEAA
jgi:hypothetical protein